MGIFFGADGQPHPDPNLTTANILVSGNLITGSWANVCIKGILPAKAEKIHVTDNVCTRTGEPQPNTGITIGRVDGNHPPAKDVLVGFNTIVANSPDTSDNAGIFISGAFHGVRIIGNQIRDFGTRPMRITGSVKDAIVSNNVLKGGQLDIGRSVELDSFSGIIQGNLIVDSLNRGIALNAGSHTGEPDTIEASIKDNIIQRSALECVRFTGDGLYRVGMIDNKFLECGGSEPVSFQQNAVLAPGSIRIHNIGDNEPHASPTGHLEMSMTEVQVNIATGDSVSIPVTVDGAKPGDIATAAFDAITGGNWQISAHVITPNQVNVVVTNHTGSTAELVGNLRITVLKFE